MKRDNSLRKMASWAVQKDPKGTKKPQHCIESKIVPKKIAPSEEKKKKRKNKQKQRKVSLLRSSPSRPRSQRCSGSSSDDAAEMGSSADLRSPRPRAPVVPGLDLSPLPPVDTPNSMRRRRLSGRGRPRQLRCRNRGCANPERTFSSERARERHEQESCSMRIQVGLKTKW